MLVGFYICVLNPNKDGYKESRYLEDILKDTCALYDVVVKKATDYHSVDRISEQLIEAIDEADIVFADANSENENVWYEIGYSDKSNKKKVICLSEESRSLPFDRSDIRSIRYKRDGEAESGFRASLARMTKDIVCDQVIETIVSKSEGVSSLTSHSSEVLTRHFESKRLHPLGVRYLEEIVRDNRRPPTQRKLALSSLSLLRAASDDTLLMASDPMINGPLKEEAYTIAAANASRRLPAEFWEQGLKSSETNNLSAFMKALVSHWLAGGVDDVWLRSEVFNSRDDRIKQELLSALRKHGQGVRQ